MLVSSSSDTFLHIKIKLFSRIQIEKLNFIETFDLKTLNKSGYKILIANKDGFSSQTERNVFLSLSCGCDIFYGLV